MSDNVFTFSLKKTAFDQNYRPAETTRITTNFANLARGERRQENLRNTLQMIDNRFNSLAHWDNPKGDRYSVELDIISVEINIEFEGTTDSFPIIEILQTHIVDKKNNERIAGVVGNNFSSYVRDYDFSVLLLKHSKDNESFRHPEGFGDLHGQLFRKFLTSDVYCNNFLKLPVICLSVSTKQNYQRTGNEHPLLGFEYKSDKYSSTDTYFSKMGMIVRYFMPKHSVAPLAFYHIGDLLQSYTNLELASTISTMETFQKIYRPEIYNANSVAAEQFSPSLKCQDYSLTRIVYDREERSRLAIEQGKFVEERFIKPYQAVLARWSASSAL